MEHSEFSQNPAADANNGTADLSEFAPLERDNPLIPTDRTLRLLVEFTKVLFDAQQRKNAELVAENVWLRLENERLRNCLGTLLRPAASEVLQ